jgi:cation transport ATPase
MRSTDLEHVHAEHAIHVSHGMPPKIAAAHTGHDRHAGHSVAIFRDKFWLTLILTLPVVVWSGEVQNWLGYTAPTFPASQYIPAFLGTTVFLSGGSVFIRGAWGELADRRPGMVGPNDTRQIERSDVAEPEELETFYGYGIGTKPLFWEMHTVRAKKVQSA